MNLYCSSSVCVKCGKQTKLITIIDNSIKLAGGKKNLNVDLFSLSSMFFEIINILIFISIVIQHFFMSFKLFPQSLLISVYSVAQDCCYIF